MDYLQKKRNDQVRQMAEDRATYRELLRTLATEMKLSPKDEVKLDAILSRLAIPLDAVEKDVVTLRDHARLTAAVAPRIKIIAEVAVIEKDADAFRDRETTALAELAALAQDINTRLAVANGRLKVVDKAVDELEHLNGTHWQLLGLRDPNVEARKRHLCQSVFEQPANPTYEVMAVEQVMSNPRDFTSMFLNTSTIEWVTLPDQPEAELRRLLTLAKQIVMDEKPGRYILLNTQADRPRFFTNVVLYADLIKRLAADQRFYVGDHAWILAPGQTDEELEKCLAAITRKDQVQTDKMTTVLMNDSNRSSWATIPQA